MSTSKSGYVPSAKAIEEQLDKARYRIRVWGIAWGLMRLDRHAAVEKRRLIFGEDLADACDAVWCSLETHERETYERRAIYVIEAQDAFAAP